MTINRVFESNLSLNTAPISPALDLNFSNSKNLDPRVEFTRSSGASYFDSMGDLKYSGINEPRFGTDPHTLESLGILVEEARTNFIKHSQDFDNEIWILENLKTSSDNILSPDKFNLADKFVGDIGLSAHSLLLSSVDISFTSGNFYSFSIFVKAREISELQLQFESTIFNGNSPNVTFDLDTNSFTLSGGGVNHTANIKKLKDGWCRISTTLRAVGTGISNIRLFLCKDGQKTYFGDGASGLYLWGAQLEEGAFTTSYIPTMGTIRNRSEDILQISGRNFTDWYNKEQGTIFIQHESLDGLENNGSDFNSILYNITGNVGDSIFYNTRSNSGNIIRVVLNNINIFSLFNATNFRKKKVFSFNIPQSTYIIYMDGIIQSGQVLANSPKYIPQFDKILFAPNVGSKFNGYIQRFTYYNRSLEKDQIQYLTT
jgi:hypothetical protein